MTQIPKGNPPATLPGSFAEAALRGGVQNRCPRCGGAKLFHKWLKPVDSCPSCQQDWSLQRADDFPPYIAILVTGHLMAPVLITLALDFHFPMWLSAVVVLPLAVTIMLSILQPAKGAIIAAQWWLGLVGFRKERPAPAGTDADSP